MILARKRPNLIPIADDAIRRLVGKCRYWLDWHAAMTDYMVLAKRLEKIKAASGITGRDLDPRALRVLDVTLWMDGKRYAHRRRDVAAPVGAILRDALQAIEAANLESLSDLSGDANWATSTGSPIEISPNDGDHRITREELGDLTLVGIAKLDVFERFKARLMAELYATYRKKDD